MKWWLIYGLVLFKFKAVIFEKKLYLERQNFKWGEIALSYVMYVIHYRIDEFEFKSKIVFFPT